MDIAQNNQREKAKIIKVNVTYCRSETASELRRDTSLIMSSLKTMHLFCVHGDNNGLQEITILMAQFGCEAENQRYHINARNVNK